MCYDSNIFFRFFFYFFKQLPAAVGDKVLDSCEIKPYIKFVKKTETIRAKANYKGRVAEGL